MLSLPDFILACPGSVALLLRARKGELPHGDLFDAWDALPDPEAYEPAEEVRIWLQSNWKELMAAVNGGETAGVAVPSCVPIPTLPTLPVIVHVPVPILREEWMAPFLAEYVKNGGVVIQAAKAGLIHRDTVYEYLKHDPEFARAFADAEEERKGLIRSTIKARAIDGWEEPVFGRMDTVQDGKVICETVVVGHVRKHDNRLLIRWAEASLEEFAKTGGGTNINVNASATANSSASATAVVIAPEKIKAIQERTRRQLEKQAQRASRNAAEASIPAL